MLSVLIPVYNYSCSVLVEELHRQLSLSGIFFELLCFDDASDVFIDENQKITKLPNTHYTTSKENIGRIAARQQLANSAKYDWLLFLDADVLPKNSDYIQSYINFLYDEYDAIFGGIAYEQQPPENDCRLRWTYGHKKENVKAIDRLKKPFKHVVSANFLIKKNVFLTINSQIDSKGYGYDNYFGAILKVKNSKVLHIDNEVFHLGIEDNAIYLNKTKQAVETLHQLHKASKITDSDNDLLELFKTLKTYKLHFVFGSLYKWFRKFFEKQLMGKNPSVTLLQLYKLSYICYLDLQ